MNGRAVVRIDGPASGAENMRIDAALLEACADGDVDCVVRIYWFDPPCLSLGRLQAVDDIDSGACRRDGVDVVRRPSGGRAVLHRDEVTYAVVCRDSHPLFGGPVLDSCAAIHATVAEGLSRLGVTVSPQQRPADLRAAARMLAARADCFAQPAAQELVDREGRKLVGSAQARTGSALLQHGSVLLEPAGAAGYLRDSAVEKSADGCPAPPGTPSATFTAQPSRGGIRRLLGRPVAREEVAGALLGAFADALGAVLDGTTA